MEVLIESADVQCMIPLHGQIAADHVKDPSALRRTKRKTPGRTEIPCQVSTLLAALPVPQAAAPVRRRPTPAETLHGRLRVVQPTSVTVRCHHPRTTRSRWTRPASQVHRARYRRRFEAQPAQDAILLMDSEEIERLRLVTLRLVYHDDLCLRCEKRDHLSNGLDKNPLALECGNDETDATSRHRWAGQTPDPT